jgi:hypothetical protein
MSRFIVSAAVVFCCAEALADVTLYSQSPNYVDFGGATSIDPLPISADDFIPTGIWQLSGAKVHGAWRDENEPIPPGTTTRSFRVQFYADNGGLPSDLPFEELSVEASLANAQPLGNPWEGSTTYDVSMTFPTPLILSPGTSYWFAAVDEGPGRGGSEGFFWSGSADGDGDVAQKDGGGWHLFQDNRGFSLFGNVVPEPASATLAIIAGFIGSLIAIRNQRVP